MTRFKYLKLLTLGLAAVSLPQLAHAQDGAITLTPGLYDISNLVTLSGFAMPSESAQECIREGENSKTPEEIVAALGGEGQCELSNVSMTGSTGRADFACKPDELPFEVAGTLDLEFGPEFLNLEGNGTLGPMGPANVSIKMQRAGECPATPAAPAP